MRRGKENFGSHFVEAVMQKERQIILSMIALGRITPREAERLLAAWSLSREESWVIAASMIVCLTQIVPALARIVHTLLPEGLPGLHHAVMAITFWIGGVL
jgi:hypothetical protein